MRPGLRMLLVVLALYALLALVQRGWLSPRTPADLLNGGAVLGLCALGETLVIVAGGIDLSVAAMAALSSVAVARAVATGVPAAVALAAAPALGALLGALVGLVIAARRLPPFLVTLAALLALRGVALLLGDGSVAITDAAHRSLAGIGLPLGAGVALGPLSLLWLSASALAAFALARTRTGRALRAVGGDARAARLLGVPIGRTTVLAHAACGGLAAAAGAAFTLHTSSGNPNALPGLELEAIAAAVLGGALLSGGVGSVAGTLLGTLLLGMIQTAITFDGRLAPGWARVATGALLLGFLIAQRAGQGALRASAPARG